MGLYGAIEDVRKAPKNIERLQVALLEYGQVVNEVGGEDVCQCAYGERVIAGDAAAQPGVRREIAEEGQSRQPDPLEVFNMAGPRELIGPSSQNANVLVETRQGFFKAASKPEGAEQKNPLAIADVTEYLAIRPPKKYPSQG